MRTLLRRIVEAGNQRGWVDQYLDGDTLGIGRGTDQEIHLTDPTVALRHAQLVLGDRPHLRARGNQDLSVNGRLCRSATLMPDDEILIGYHRLKVIEPPAPGIRLALLLETVGTITPLELEESRFRTRLADVRWLRQRPLAWLLFLLVLGLCLVAPMLVAYMPEWRKDLRESPLPDDSAWLAGPLHSVHAFIGDDCQACHTQTFNRVEDDACIACHGKTGRHVDPVHHRMPELEQRSCASCHHEHNESVSLVVDEQPFCAGCHAGLSARLGGATKLEDVRDFGKAHPPFRMSLRYYDPGSAKWLQTDRVDVTAALRERSNLKFDHRLHVAKEGLKNEQGVFEVLTCRSCHQTGRDGMLMQTASMENNCQRCHALTFDVTAPQRTVPHGDPDRVIASLREFYSQRFVDDIRNRPADTRQPGGATVDVLQAEGVAWVNAEVARAGRDLFERRTCITCHDVQAVERDGTTTWTVTPVSLNAHWFPSAFFNHSKHQTMQCGDCHPASKSTDAGQILTPRIETCRKCHSGGEGGPGIESGCVACHRFHLPHAGFIGDRLAPDGTHGKTPVSRELPPRGVRQ